MKTNAKLSALMITAAIMAGSSAQSQTLLSVDLGDSGTSPAGFQGWDTTAPNNNAGYSLVTTTFGSISLAINASSIPQEGTAPAVDGSGNLAAWGNGEITRSRSPISTTPFGSMYQDFVTAAGGGSVGLQISGLSANTVYDITLFSFDENGSRTSTFTDYTTGTGNLLGTITYSNPSGAGSGDPTTEYQYALTAAVTTDSNGRLTIAETEPGNAPILNGFQITAVPEPGTMSLLGGGITAAMLFHGRRRKSNRA